MTSIFRVKEAEQGTNIMAGGKPHSSALKLEAICLSKTLVDFQRIT
jgi:hypothetical protein